jgi:Flp pilus assembly protein TadB
MGPLPFVFFVFLGCIGIITVIVGLTPKAQDETAKMPSKFQRRVNIWRGQFTRKRQLIALAGLAGGIILWLLTGWIIALIAVPAAAIGIPLLLGKGNAEVEIARLEAIESWTRSLASLISTGSGGLEQAITLSLASTPDAIHEYVGRLVARLNARWPVHDALQQFADDLDDPTGDLVVAHLQLAARQRGAGLARALEDLAQDCFDEVKARRQIEADRAKPRQNTRLITYVTLALLAVIPFAGQFFAPYKTPVGQLLMAMWLLIYVGVLVWIKQFSAGKSTPRILTNPREKA